LTLLPPFLLFLTRLETDCTYVDLGHRNHDHVPSQTPLNLIIPTITLLEAAELGDVGWTRELLARGANIHHRDAKTGNQVQYT
jgi:hypothetical protein